MRSPSSRAATSVPNRGGIFRPAARAPFAYSAAAADRPTPSTSSASSIVIVATAFGSATFGGCAGGGGGGVATVVVVTGAIVVTGTVVVVGAVVVVCVVSVVVVVVVVVIGAVVVGCGGASSCCNPKTRFASAWSVRFAVGRNVSGVFAPISPALVTMRISGRAQSCATRFDAAAVPTGTSASTAARPAVRPLTRLKIDSSSPGL